LPKEYRPPLGYDFVVEILEYDNHSIPVVKLTPRPSKIYVQPNKCMDTIVYAHGNSSDMADGLKFVEKMALKYEAEYIVFDYNGYG
jgi:hypothetical protein